MKKLFDNFTVLYRKSQISDIELNIIEKYFSTTDCMVGVKDSLVIGRYSCVPFYAEVEKGLRVQNSRFINSLYEHLYIANFYYYHDIKEYTPKTYLRLDDVPKNNTCSYVVKGVTNSKKHNWNTQMYAENRDEAIRIAIELKRDFFFANQDIIVREYVPLIKLGDSINGLAFTNEWRCFFYKKHLLSYAFYWTESEVIGKMNQEGLEFVQNIANIVGENTNFYTIDIGQKEIDKSWIVIELNDGQMAGFDISKQDELFHNLKNILR